MKFLNKAITYLLPAAMLFSVSCSDFIDIEPENKLPEESVDFSKTENMYQPVVGVYAEVRTSGMHWANKMLMTTRDGDLWSGRTDDQGTAVDFGRYFNYNNSFWALNNVWQTYYAIVRTANGALESLDGYAAYLTPGSEQYKNYEAYCGEVRTIRAWAYYNLTTCFGAVPLYKDNLQTDFYRVTQNSVFKYMLEEDLAYAIEKLPRIRPNQSSHFGAVTAFTAEMLAAKVYLLQGNYEEVEKLTDDIIKNGGFELYPDFYNLFKIPGKMCDESLFECQVTDYGVGSGDQVGVDQWFNFAGPFSISAPDGSKSFGGWGFVGYEPEFVAWADARGETVRATTSFLRAGQATPEGWIVCDARGTSTDCWNGKDYLPYDQLTEGRTGYGTNNNVRIFRYAEVLLMNSEAKKRLYGNEANGSDYGINEVRKRANMPALTNATVEQVLDERRMELCSEWGIRYQDLVRTGKAAEVLGKKGWDESKTYWPVPQSQLDELPGLKEEPREE